MPTAAARSSASGLVPQKPPPSGSISCVVLQRRGLAGVKLVVSDAHEGLKAAVAQVFAGATWQRCRVHCMRNLLAHVPKGQHSMVAAAIRTVFAQANQPSSPKRTSRPP